MQVLPRKQIEPETTSLQANGLASKRCHGVAEPLKPAISSSHSGRGFTLVEIMIVVGVIGLLATIAVPKFARARALSEKNLCLSNLREIESAKQQWGIENNHVNTDTPSNTDLTPYMRSRTLPVCPASGTYTLGDLETAPICNLAGHTY